jgi:small subunit ribosomal protein S21
MLRVKVDSSSIEKSLKIFKRKYKESGVVNELRERQQFTKKSTKKRQQKQKAIYNQIKKREEDE